MLEFALVLAHGAESLEPRVAHDYLWQRPFNLDDLQRDLAFELSDTVRGLVRAERLFHASRYYEAEMLYADLRARGCDTAPVRWTSMIGLRLGWGVGYRGAHNHYRVHFAIPTPAVEDGVRARLRRATVPFTADEGVTLEAVHVWDDPNQAFTQDGLSVGGENATLTDGRNSFEIPGHRVRWGIGVSAMFQFAGAGNVTLHAAGRRIRTLNAAPAPAERSRRGDRTEPGPTKDSGPTSRVRARAGRPRAVCEASRCCRGFGRRGAGSRRRSAVPPLERWRQPSRSGGWMQIGEVRALVTGAASGLGYRFALELARAGAKVAAVDIDGDGLRRLAAESAGLPGRVETMVGDITDESAVKAFVRDADERFGGVNVLVNNAAVLMDGLLVADDDGWIRRLPTAQWRRALDVNLTGQFLVAREVAASMLERCGEGNGGEGVIVNISSLARSGNAGQSVYGASKAGLDSATRTWALELAPHGIRVASIAPGVIQTPLLDNISEEARASLLAGIPVGRFGDPFEVWLALRFVIECGFFTGRVLELDGGARM
ncbi:MAG TPA: SDR family NAD(P)-dependent oxidoreductase [Longimicrobium sp.]